MIKVIIKPLTEHTHDHVSNLIAKTINSLALPYAEKIRKELINAKCPDHLRSYGEIMVTGNKATKKLVVEKGDFCCQRFKDLVKVERNR
jgi:hypothetical protein